VGRPPALPEEERKALILQAAEAVFARMGYGDATMEEVARVCGMAKKTVYKFFPDKLSLFGALVASHDILMVNEAAPTSEVDDTVSRLHRLVGELARFILSPRQVTLTRLVIAEAGKSPELAERFYRECVEKTQSHVAQAMEQALPPSIRANVAPSLLAEMLIGAALGTLHFKALMLNLDLDDVSEELAARVALTTEIMLAGLGERSAPPNVGL
jgi:AcrR family transcriptional regulator